MFFWFSSLLDQTSDPLTQTNLQSLIQDNSERTQTLLTLAKIDSTYLLETLAAARLIQDTSERARALRNLVQIDSAYFPEALAAAQSIQNECIRALMVTYLADINSIYFPEVLAVVRSIQNERDLAGGLIDLARINSIHFPEALAAARSIQDNSDRAWSLMKVAQINPAYYPEALLVVPLMQNEDLRATVLCNSYKELPQVCLPQALKIISTITDKIASARSLTLFFSRLPLATLPYDDWRSHLHCLAHRTRADLMRDLTTLYPAIVHLGGKEAVRGMVDAMREVCNQWK